LLLVVVAVVDLTVQVEVEQVVEQEVLENQKQREHLGQLVH
jgi:hypothetical protein